MRAEDNYGKAYEEGFELCKKHLIDIESMIVKEFEKGGCQFSKKVYIVFENSEDLKTINSTSELFDTTQTLINQRVSGIRIMAQANKSPNDEERNYSIDECIVTYGKKPYPLGEKDLEGRIYCRVFRSREGLEDGANAEAGNNPRDLYNQLIDCISDTLIKENLFLRIANFIKLNQFLAVSLSLIIFFTSVFVSDSFRIVDHSSRQDSILSVTQRLEELYENAPPPGDTKNTDAKVDFLFKERLLKYELELLESQPGGGSLNYTIRASFFGYLLMLGISMLGIFSCAKHFPQENFIWGKYEQIYSNIKIYRNVIWGMLLLGLLASFLASISFESF